MTGDVPDVEHQITNGHRHCGLFLRLVIFVFMAHFLSTLETENAANRFGYARKKALSRVCFNGNAPWQPVHQSSIRGDCNAGTVRSHNPELAETPPCIPVNA